MATFHRTLLGYYSQHLQADLRGFVATTPEEVRDGYWSEMPTDAEAATIAAANTRAVAEAEIALAAWRDGYATR